MVLIIMIIVLAVLYFILKSRFDSLEYKIDRLNDFISNLNESNIGNTQTKSMSSEDYQKQLVSKNQQINNTTLNKLQQIKKIQDNTALEYEEYGVNSISNVQKVPNLNTVQNENIRKFPKQEKVELPKAKKEDGVFTRFIKWLREDWPMKIGGFLVILATGWFVTYAAEQGWLSEIARVVLGYLFGIATLTYGSIRSKTVQLQGNVFLIIGVAAIFISTLAGVNFPTVSLSEIAALFVMFITVGFVSLLALNQRNINLSGSTIFFGATVPLFFFDALDIDIIFLYLLILTLGTLWIVAKSNWRSLTLMMLVVVMFYAVGHAITTGDEISILKNMVVSIIFASVFYGANVVAIVKTKKIKPIDIVTAIGNGILYMTLTLMFSPKYLEVFFLLFGVMMFSTASYVIFRYSKSQGPTVIYGAISFILLVIATAIQFENETSVFTIALTIEFTALVLLMIYILRQKITNLFKIFSIILYLFPMLFVLARIEDLFDFIGGLPFNSLNDMWLKPYYRYNSFEDVIVDLFVVFVACLTTFLIAGSITKFIGFKEKENLIYMRIFAYFGGIITITLIWLSTHVFLHSYQDIASFLSLFIFTILGVGFYVLGFKVSHKAYRVLGIILFSIVLLRIFFVEFWDMDMPVKIFTAFILGALFISTAFFAKFSSRNK